MLKQGRKYLDSKFDFLLREELRKLCEEKAPATIRKFPTALLRDSTGFEGILPVYRIQTAGGHTEDKVLCPGLSAKWDLLSERHVSDNFKEILVTIYDIIKGRHNVRKFDDIFDKQVGVYGQQMQRFGEGAAVLAQESAGFDLEALHDAMQDMAVSEILERWCGTAEFEQACSKLTKGGPLPRKLQEALDAKRQAEEGMMRLEQWSGLQEGKRHLEAAKVPPVLVKQIEQNMNRTMGQIQLIVRNATADDLDPDGEIQKVIASVSPPGERAIREETMRRVYSDAATLRRSLNLDPAPETAEGMALAMAQATAQGALPKLKLLGEIGEALPGHCTAPFWEALQLQLKHSACALTDEPFSMGDSVYVYPAFSASEAAWKSYMSKKMREASSKQTFEWAGRVFEWTSGQKLSWGSDDWAKGLSSVPAVEPSDPSTSSTCE